MTIRERPLLILPAAGFGRRVGSPPAKELLINPFTQRPLIDFYLDLAKSFSLDVLVITRKDKVELVDYLRAKGNLSVLLIGESLEWPDTVLKSKDWWREKNILALPDTYFSPLDTISDLVRSLDEFTFVAGTFDVLRPNTWGVLEKAGKHYFVGEKPENWIELEKKNGKAWGLLGFQKSVGALLFNILLESNMQKKWIQWPYDCKEHPLEFFKDLTR